MTPSKNGDPNSAESIDHKAQERPTKILMADPATTQNVCVYGWRAPDGTPPDQITLEDACCAVKNNNTLILSNNSVAQGKPAAGYIS